jgi:glycosyltransferase involved in cell wall biosynthesis
VPPGLEQVRVHRLGRCTVPEEERPRQERRQATRKTRRRLAALGPLDLVYERYTLWSYAAMEHAREAGVPGVLEVNGPRVTEAAASGALIDRAAAEEASARTVTAATAIVAVSERIASWLDDTYGVGDRVEVVPNGVDMGRFPPALLDVRRAPGRPFTVGWVGWFRKWIDVDPLLVAFARLRRDRPDARLVLIGGGQMRQSVEERAAGLGLADAVELTGPIPPEQVPERLARMDAGVAIYPSGQRAHSSSLKVLEYLASGLAVVAGGADQLEDQVRHGETGLLCDTDAPDQIAAALETLAADAELRDRLGAAGRADVAARFSWDNVAERVLALARIRAEEAHGR